MKKSLLALAVLGTFASIASAQSSVTLSGMLDAGVIRKGAASTSSASDWTLGGSQSGYNNFTISAREDLGGGMAAFFSMNHRFAINSGAVNSQTGVFWRNVSVGLAGSFGDVRLGRILMPLQDMNGGFDPWATGTVASIHTGGINATIRAHNAIYYRSPSMGGLKVEAAIAAGEGQLSGETANNFGSGQGLGAFAATGERPVGFSVRYAAGPLNVGVAYDKNYRDVKTTGVYGSYDFGAAKLWGQFEKGDSITGNASGGWITTSEELKNFSLGVTAPMGPVLLRAGIVRTNSNLANHDGSKFGFGGDYNLSKRTNLYADVAKFSGDRYKAGVINTSVNQTKAQFDIGVTHRF